MAKMPNTVGTALWDCGYWDHSVNGINFNHIYKSQITLLYQMNVSIAFAYCYYLINVISLGLDPTKRARSTVQKSSLNL